MGWLCKIGLHRWKQVWAHFASYTWLPDSVIYVPSQIRVCDLPPVSVWGNWRPVGVKCTRCGRRQ